MARPFAAAGVRLADYYSQVIVSNPSRSRAAPSFRTGFFAVVIVGGMLALLSNLAFRPEHRPTLIIYGDSLTVQSEADARHLHGAAKEHLLFRARGGTAMCDWISRAAYDRLTVHPDRVVLAFTGNTASCASAAFLSGGPEGVTALYERSLREMRAIFWNVPVTVVIPPAVNNLPTGWYPYNGSPGLAAMYKRVSAELGMTINTDADDWLTPHHVFAQRRPAYPTGPLVDVRLSDGIHLTPAGELWYGAALLR